MAIARDTSGGTGLITGTTNTLSYTMGTVTNGVLFVEVEQEATSDQGTGCTFNGVAMTLLKTISQSNGGGFQTLNSYFLANPAAGTHNIVFSSASVTSLITAHSYSGASQVTPTNIGFNSNISSTTLAVTLTASASTSWVVGAGTNNQAQISITSGGTIQNNSGNIARANFDSNGTVTAGSFTTNWTQANGTTGAVFLGISVELAVPGGTTFTPTLTEAITTTATLLKSTTRPIAESITVTATLLRTLLRSLTDAITNTATLTSLKVRPANLTDLVSITDSLLKSTVRVLTDTLTVTDTLAVLKMYVRTYTESVTNSDTFARTLVHGATLVESITNTLSSSFKLNGTNVIWTHVKRSTASVWTHISKSNQ